MPGKRLKNVTNPQAHEAWRKRKRELNEANTLARQFQKIYRVGCLKQRAKERRLTKKNFDECKRLGLTGTQYEPLEAQGD